LAFFLLISRLPFWWLYRLSDLLCFLLYKGLKYRLKVVRSNLSHSFPEKSESERREIEKAFYAHLCDVIVETIKLLTISESELKSRVSHENPEILFPHFRNGGSFISMAPHLGNWEWLLAGNKIYLGCEVDAVYKPLSSPFFEKLMLRVRSRFGSFPVPSTRILRIEAERKSISRAIAMVADQTPGPENAFVQVFLNRPTLFFRGPQKLAHTFQYPVFYASMDKTGRGHYRIRIEEIAICPLPGEDEILKRFIQKLEADIRKQPAFWLWSHKRWKHKIPGGDPVAPA
jgi:KDO2-lipid IV(A) lauroyltransferase